MWCYNLDLWPLSLKKKMDVFNSSWWLSVPVVWFQGLLFSLYPAYNVFLLSDATTLNFNLENYSLLRLIMVIEWSSILQFGFCPAGKILKERRCHTIICPIFDRYIKIESQVCLSKMWEVYRQTDKWWFRKLSLSEQKILKRCSKCIHVHVSLFVGKFNMIMMF
jgi:hypothetical protein